MKTAWATLAPRERRLVALAAAAVVLTAVWLGVIRPALKLLREAPQSIARFDQELVQLRSSAEELARLKLAPRRSAPADFSSLVAGKAKAALGASAKVTASNAEVRAQAEAVAVGTALALLQDVADNAQARADEMTLTSLGDGRVKMSVKWVPKQ